ncbi:uncharacterized protein LOC121413293 [Lytechinus variegatus]|uniref:uncharacterized protein LOC121413293 n=1 Tax=Lytechinus variegatus TaxID=7654 RepID=UPI001BB16F7D|nr:uncharacterized protein LOC121413293 [Lytechinus variegatus]XP_041461998.1 uncharacterized protein LOC121413293 [Lytechinus variegatus]XP_041461999.1 uncharacterized protein LOC121413293 [Lytechinus variegatus]
MEVPEGPDDFEGIPNIPKVFGDATQAVKVFSEYNRLAFSDEFQQIFNERMDFTKPDVLEKLQSVWLQASYKALDNTGFGHLKDMLGPGKIPDLLKLMFMAYNDCPEVIKLGAFVRGPYAQAPPPNVVTVGSSLPELNLISLAGETVGLSDLHINKDRPMMVMASSAS